jgi:hypothetical protein
MFNIKRSIVSLLAIGLFTMASVSNALAGDPFKTLRLATNANGTIFVGLGIAPGSNSIITSSAGVTVTHTPGHYHVEFATGTWSGCFFVPLVQSVFTMSPAEITAWATFGNGSGFVDIAITSGADVPLMMVFTSAAC